jgi:hypothetical protein
MSADTPPSLKTELDYLTSLAEAGNRAPLNIGRALFWAGLIYGGASLIQYFVIIKLIRFPNPWFMTFLWLGAIALHMAAIFIGRNKKCPGADSAANRAAQAAWSGVGMGIFSFFMAVVVLSIHFKRMEEVSFLMASTVLSIYGIGWWVSARMSETKWLYWVSFACFLAAPALCLLAGYKEQLLAYAVCLLCLATVPGYKLMLDARK